LFAKKPVSRGRWLSFSHLRSLLLFLLASDPPPSLSGPSLSRSPLLPTPSLSVSRTWPPYRRK
jgi:hypothetical protein